MSQTIETPMGFDEMNLDPAVLAAVRDAGYTCPTPIQAQTIPPLTRGADLVGQARTGTGKTAAFALPLLSRIDLGNARPQVLVLTPTRELAIQVADSFKSYGARMKGLNVLAVYGGQSYGVQLNQLKRGVHVVVGTPGRLMDHLRRKTLTLADLEAVVLDEADEMLHMGFIEDVEWILEKTPEDIQTALFSATMPAPIRKIAHRYLTDPQEISIASGKDTLSTITQSYWYVKGARKGDALVRFLEAMDTDGVIVFARTKSATVEITKQLEEKGFRAEALNGDMAQAARERTVNRLKNRHIDILVATDVAARGLDVDRISHVFNYDMTSRIDPYVHRIGRTGRAGRTGEAILFLNRNEKWLLKRIRHATGQEVKEVFLPTHTDINARRVDAFQKTLSQTMANKDLTLFTELVQDYVKETEAPMEMVAAALAQMAHGDRPFYLPPEAKHVRKDRQKPDRQKADRQKKEHSKKDFGPGKKNFQKSDREGANATPGKNFSKDRKQGKPESRGDRSERPMEPLAKGMERFRIQVGRSHGLKARDVVGAISNESGLEGKFIRNVTIQGDFSFVDLPKGMPKSVYKHLKKVWVRSKRMDIARCD